MKRTGMNDINDILRQRHDLELTRDRIAAATGMSAGTVSHVPERAAAAGLSWPLPDDLDDEALRARLYRRTSTRSLRGSVTAARVTASSGMGISKSIT